MKRYAFCVLVVIFFAGFFVSEKAGAVDVYTFKKERVDQELDGNRGYIMGTAPEIKERGSRKRTLIGVDVELPVTAKEEVKAEVSESEVPVEATVVSVPEEVKAEIIEVSPYEEKVTEVEIQEESEDEWIK